MIAYAFIEVIFTFSLILTLLQFSKLFDLTHLYVTADIELRFTLIAYINEDNTIYGFIANK